MAKIQTPFRPLNISVLTVSDTRSLAEDTSGDALIELLTHAGHNLSERKLVKDDVYQMRAAVSHWIASDATNVVLITGGTGFYSRDSTPEAMIPLFDKNIEGFGELFRHISYLEIGTSTIQSRAIAGLANQTLIFCLPGSTGACKTAWNGILKEQLDASHRPCNFVSLLIGPYVPSDVKA
ncbi:molybdenum cofactor biosynthesis protein B [Marinomonas sp. IMCC 4694]|uniref:molybdenum cofactor biosynthesis protein B n=1 Tax=Marinomonas sp. IMCC 4694 TaxID=2605432 RepID=UPI0011E838B1|nr:molybdenum cofactor biosynthesis protein B [Marinomonas sp. IMCC 4694]TYL47272.1 molybdenum cofactor biosynthesis protein B [Marinomonas sp. IMCC 4694]